MRLWFKIFLTIIGIILCSTALNMFFTYKVVENSRIKNIETTEVLFAKSLAARFFRDIAENKNIKLTDVLFDEKRLREEKIEYILVFDRKGYLLAYAYWGKMFKRLLKLNNAFDAKSKYRIERIENNELDVYDVAVPVMEGIQQVGTIHVGIKLVYLRKSAQEAVRVLIIIMVISCVLGTLIVLLISKALLRPLERLTKATVEISGGNLDTKIEVSSRDEIGNLGIAFNRMVGNLKKTTTSIDNLNKEITERKKVEEKLNQALKEEVISREIMISMLADNNQIRQKLEQNIEELKASYSKLKEVQAQVVQSAKLASLGQMAGGVAHEINNPLTGVLNNVQLIKMVAGNKESFDIKEFKELLDIVEESAQRCRQITQSLLDFSHASTGISQPLSLNEVAEKVAILVAHELKLQNIVIQKELLPDLPLILGDFQLLQQVIFNFISNAKWAIQKKSAKEGGTITIRTQYEALKKEVHIFVSDSGVGISEDNLKKIFESFFSTKEVGEGTGLGLSLAQDIVYKHGGRIEVESRLGEGATFKVSFPVISEVK